MVNFKHIILKEKERKSDIKRERERRRQGEEREGEEREKEKRERRKKRKEHSLHFKHMEILDKHILQKICLYISFTKSSHAFQVVSIISCFIIKPNTSL